MLAVLTALATACTTAAPEPTLLGAGKKIRVAAKGDQPGTGFEPHDGEFEGFDITVTQEVLGRLGIDAASIRFDGVLSKNRAKSLREGDFDLVVATYSITLQRTLPVEEGGEGLDFVGPYASTPQGVLVRAADKDRYRGLSDLDGRQVCVWKGTTSLTELSKPAYQLIRLREEKDAGYCVKALKAGEVDAVSTDQLILYGFMEAEPTLAVVPGIAFGVINDYGIAMHRTPAHRKECERLREALKKYVSGNDWDRDLANDLPRVPVAARNEAKPTTAEIDALSCRERPANAKVD
ncbi:MULTISPECIES: transporter substrate-binding domain-containing protein [Streptomyces]|uniref:transporter substrate-binding domain-containing protein n=1 Tax=Streptomyces TaxID=1883 RepID=UPI001CC23EDF|nr:transporter substrate-binding domain-containing protein [Streptomyces venezuelae]